MLRTVNVPAKPAMRNWRQRTVQTLTFEAIGLALVTPAFSYFAGKSLHESLGLLIALSAAVMCWTAVYNTAFDFAERQIANRVASDRPHHLRFAHAIGHELTAILVTWPLIILISGLPWKEALLADLALTITYAVYAYFFHLGFDRFFPVTKNV